MNEAPSVLDFNPSGASMLLGNKLDIFDKSNSTIHINTAGMDYFNGNNPFEWRIDELFSYSKYNSYFNTDYINRLFTKVENGLLKEILNCKSKQTGGALVKAKIYCGIS